MESSKGSARLFVASGDASEALDAGKEVFDTMSLFEVQPLQSLSDMPPGKLRFIGKLGKVHMTAGILALVLCCLKRILT